MQSPWESWSRNEELNGGESRPPSRSSHQSETTTADDSSGNSSPSTAAHGEAEPTEIDASNLGVYSAKFLVDGKHIVSGSEEGKIRCWRVDDGKEVGLPIMDAGSPVYNIAISQDGKRIVGGTCRGKVAVWAVDGHRKPTEFKAHKDEVNAVDVSPDGTRIATGSNDRTVVVWSLEGRLLLGPLKHEHDVAAVKFSPDGRFIATATWEQGSVCVYDGLAGDRLFSAPIRVNSPYNQSLAWANNCERQQLFALSPDGNIHCLDVSSRTALSTWRIHDARKPKCIALACDGTFIAASDDTSVSLWDTQTHRQLGSVISHSHVIESMAISTSYDIVTVGKGKITVRSLCDTLPLRYRDSIHLERELRSMMATKPDPCHIYNFIRAQFMRLYEIIAKLENTVKEAQEHQAMSLYTAKKREDSLLQIISAHEKKHQCDKLYAEGRIYDASRSFLDIADNMNEELRANKLISDWVSEFTNQCTSRLKTIGDEASDARKYDEALGAYSTALSFNSSVSNTVLESWVRTMLRHRSINDAWNAADKFKLPRFHVFRKFCELLERDNRISEAIAYFRQMRSRSSEDTKANNEQTQWDLDFRTRCIKKLEKLGDDRIDVKDYDAAIECFTEALSLDPTHASAILSKRSEARAAVGLWEEALSDATKTIQFDPSLYKGYEQMHTALHGMKRYKEAFKAFETMLSRINGSSNPNIRQLRDRYRDATPTIRRIVDEIIRQMPHVLIDTVSGCLLDKTRQAAEFEQLPIFDELRSSMTTQVDDVHIREEVKFFYRYVMLSHKWQPNEPTFQMVENIPIFRLPVSPTNDKLRTFCKVARHFQFRWAWSDTCCVNQADKGIQQESIIAMFRWYRNSSLTVVHLLGVLSESQEFGCLWKSIWNERGWTYQEYIASRAIQFYTEDWKPYLGLDLFNHKESSIILSEMERAMNLTTPELVTLCPGLDRVREKLYLASRRQTTREEDIAYSLFGIFNVILPVIYGEGNQAVGRLLENILTRSNNITLLAWKGTSGSHHSWLPADLTVYSEIVPPHIPQLIESTMMDNMVSVLRSSSLNLSLATALYDQLHNLPSLSLSSGRLQLHCIAFPLSNLFLVPKPPCAETFVYRATTHILFDVEIKTKDDLARMGGLLLIHPWISPLLDLDFDEGVPRFDPATRALRLIIRLRQRFGALLLAPVGRVHYKRVAADSLIMVQIRKETRLEELMESVRTVDVQ